MAGKRTRRASQAFQPTKISEDEFTSGDKFVFTIDSPSPKGRVTRSRRSSICLNPPTKPVTKARRQTMLPAVKEMPKSPVKKKKSNVVDQLLKTPSKNIGEFYASPAKAKDLKEAKNSQTSPIKSVSAASSSVSPTKKFSKSSNRTLTELEILENLESEESDVEMEDKEAPLNAMKVSKTDIPAEKTTGKVDKKSKIPVKSPPPTKSGKTKPSKVTTKEPVAKTKEPAVKTTRTKKSPKKESKSPGLVKPQLKTPKKTEKISLKNLPPGSPLLDSIFKDIKKVEIRLTPMKIKEDPNVIFDLLEEHQQSKFRVQKVVDEIVKMKKESSPQTRLNASKDESVVEVTNVEKKKAASKTKSVSKPTKKNEKKTDSSPALKPRGRAVGAKNTAVEVEGTIKNTETEKKQSKKNSKEEKPKAVTKPQEKKVSSKEKMPSKTGVKRALETKATPIQNKRIKLEKETPKTPKPVETSKKNKSKTPATSKKQLKTPKPEIKAEPITPVTPEVASVVSKSKSTAKKSASKKTPKLMVQYKQKTPIGSLKKPLKRLSVAKSTPAQVKPSDLLRKNLKRQVETAITKKIGSKPDSSPYTISVTDGSDASPVFTKVEAVTSKVVKKHITGTPARTKPTRKFGTVIQPISLLEDSVMPSSNVEHKAVSSSTPLRAAVTGFEENINEPHPLESVEATPIRAPSCVEPKSPEPMMVTGGLAKMCSIM